MSIATTNIARGVSLYRNVCVVVYVFTRNARAKQLRSWTLEKANFSVTPYMGELLSSFASFSPSLRRRVELLARNTLTRRRRVFECRQEIIFSPVGRECTEDRSLVVVAREEHPSCRISEHVPGDDEAESEAEHGCSSCKERIDGGLGSLRS